MSLFSSINQKLVGDFNYIQNINDTVSTNPNILCWILINIFFLLFLLIKRPTKRILILPVKQIRCRRGWRFSIKKMLNRYMYITANKYSSDLGKTKNWISMRIKWLVATLNLLPTIGLGENMICWTDKNIALGLRPWVIFVSSGPTSYRLPSYPVNYCIQCVVI